MIFGSDGILIQNLINSSFVHTGVFRSLVRNQNIPHTGRMGDKIGLALDIAHVCR